MSPERRSGGLIGRDAWLPLCFAGIFALGVLAVAGSWEPAHDEGVSWTQALGAVEIPGCREGPAPIGELVAALEGDPDHGFGGVVEALWSDGMHPPAYYYLLRSWGRTFGIDRMVLVVPAILLGFLGLLAIGRVCERLAKGPGSSSLGMALLATSPWFVSYSVFARPYSMAIVVAIAATWAVADLGLRVPGSRRRRISCAVFVALSILGLYTIYHYVFVLAWHGVALTIRAFRSSESRAREWRSLALMALAIGIGFAPWLPFLFQHLDGAATPGYYFAGATPIADWPLQWMHLLEVFLLGPALWSSWGGGLVAAIVLAGAVTLPFAVLAFRSAALQNLDSMARSLWFAAPVVPVAIFTSDLLRETHTLFISKTAFALFPLLLLLLVRAVLYFRTRWRAAWVLAVWPVIFAIATIGFVRDSARFATGYEVIVDVLAKESASPHLVLFSSTRRGYTVPFLLEARESGLDTLSVAYAEREDLEACLEKAMGSDRLQQITLLDFGVPYRKQDFWGELPREILAARTREKPWEAVFLDPNEPALAASSDARQSWLTALANARSPEKRLLLIIRPAKVKYFSE